MHASYPGGGFSVTSNHTRASFLAVVQSLHDNGFLDSATRMLAVELNLFYQLTAKFVSISLLIEFPPSGGIYTSSFIQNVKIFRYSGSAGFILLVVDAALGAVALYYLYEEVREIRKAKWRYLAEMWNYIDLIVIALVLWSLMANFNTYNASKTLDLRNFESEFVDIAHIANIERMQITINSINSFFVFFKVSGASCHGQTPP